MRDAGERAGAEVVQLYASDKVASVTRPVVRLVGFARVEPAPGESAKAGFDVPARLPAFTGRDGRRVVEPGEIGLSVRGSVAEPIAGRPVDLTGPVYEITGSERRLTAVSAEPGKDDR
ncbi:fibronectin type III-like domain-contianing protein [Nonomuraea sp. NPDC050153]|uniref:fibronectin type III-like domain-contianing protein n=1 Tax=Nonomuraea sp. NPDC050153 TaxID=3364359 RepID=UPI0037B0DDE0